MGDAPRGRGVFTTASGFQWDTGGSGSMGAPSLSRSVLTLQTPVGEAGTHAAPSGEAAQGPLPFSVLLPRDPGVPGTHLAGVC